ncbi:hypothetical protein POM88_010900 [Heracleum sosnowskyi]|uniref:Uncharacterized protein n=1 Tax=Heracleum sosnowskyi TaxID=360622 RepID=A0AAD8IVA0_9APIA|nr:hypothetical protein POM88_010900 [Heracleum sosnowskyi]
MGNCIKKESSMQWGGDDWSDDYSDQEINPYSQNYTYKKITEQEEDTGASTNDDVYTESMKETTQVKLRITRKQLEELLTESTTKIQGVSAEQVLAHLINVSMHNDDFHSHQHHSWRPHLPTITEV